MSTFEAETIWFLQHRARDFKGSVWEPTFLSAMIRAIKEELWREFPHEAWGRRCRFNDVKDFLTGKDGLDLPDLKACCTTIRSVADSSVADTIRKDAKTTLRDLARQLLAELEAVGVDELAAAAAEAEPLPEHGEIKGKKRDPKTGLFIAVEEAKQDPLGFHGEQGLDRSESRGSNRTSGRGETQHYLLRRIARDCPELLDDIGPGKPYRSARAAAIAAGIVKDIPTVRLTDPAKAATAVLQKQGREWAAQMAAALTELLTEEPGHE